MFQQATTSMSSPSQISLVTTSLIMKTDVQSSISISISKYSCTIQCRIGYITKKEMHFSSLMKVWTKNKLKTHLGTRDFFLPPASSLSEDWPAADTSESSASRSSSSITGSKCSSTKDGCFVDAIGWKAKYSCENSSISKSYKNQQTTLIKSRQHRSGPNYQFNYRQLNNIKKCMKEQQNHTRPWHS